MNNEIDWFCTLGVGRGLFALEQVKALLEISSPETTLMEFAQGTLDNGFTTDVASLQQIMEEAVRDAAQVGVCPESVLAPPPSAEPEVNPLATVNTAQADAPRRRLPSGNSSGPKPPLPGDSSAAPSSAPTQAAAPAAAPKPTAKNGDYDYVSQSHTYPFDLNGFPNLSEVEQNPGKAADLVKQFLQYARSIKASDVHVYLLVLILTFVVLL